MEKDFYSALPGMVCVQLDKVFIPKFSSRDWFPKAWEEYRQHVKESDIETMKMPMFIFKKYLSEEDLGK